MLDRLRHRREALPERAALDARSSEATELDARLAEATARRDDVAREEQRFDDESRSLEGKAVEVERRMYSGEVSSPRELQAMQADVEQLRRHRRGIDERELELMEQREVLEVAVDELEQALVAMQADLDRLQAAIASQEAEIDGELKVAAAARADLVADVSDSLLATYERCRARARGIGAARIVGDTCQGCHLSIPATEVDRIRHQPPDTLAHCDNCGCILLP